MIKIVATFKVKPGMNAEFVKFCQPLIESSQKEAGNISYELFQNRDDEGAMAFIEEWRDQSAIDFHNDTEEFKSAAGGLDKYLASSLQIDFYTRA